MRKTYVFVFGFLIVNLLLSQAYLHIMKSSQLLHSDEIMKSLSSDIDYLVMGTSHSLAVQTTIFPNSSNVASYGEGIHNTYYKLNYIINELSVKPSKVILSCDLGMLKHSDIDHQNYQFYWNRYENHAELLHFAEHPTEFIINRITDYLFPYKNGEIEVFDYFFAKKTTVKNAALRNQNEIKKLSVEEKKVLDSACQNQQISELGQYYFEQIIELCRLHDIELILIRFPVTPHYYYQHSTCFDPELYYDTLTKTFIRSDDQIKLYDFHNIYDESAFADPDHLKGGKIRDNLTRLILDELEKKN
ncbi:hypothetical protein N6H18_03065 [Reichenbachiella agarivorans]|uniref:SGNH/GDSL hydrolase family protein n=1 Tax=Reichenbachiella agarivorans TaxID=2979464 RepID=A0ABY6CSF1_9BACT|nr:hypothetical protein [Reichenbachiella agarivorans]UXP32935.1 hypothetical protein N6H18_03065 [Reichenbachiella agarivorans]